MKKTRHATECFFAMLCFAVLGSGSPAQDVRVWTSRSGATVEASFQFMQEGEAVLETKDGQRLVIRPDLLSEADQAYLKAQQPSVQVPEIVAPRPPRHPTSRPGMRMDEIPGLSLRTPARAQGFAIQYGPQQPQHVVVVFDASTENGLLDIMHVYQTGPSQKAIATGGTVRNLPAWSLVRFPSIPFHTQDPNAPFQGNLTFTSGEGPNYLIWMHATIETGRDGKPITLHYAGAINTKPTDDRNIARWIDLTRQPRISLLTPPTQRIERTLHVYGSISQGDIILTGPRDLIESIKITSKDADATPDRDVKLSYRFQATYPLPMQTLFDIHVERVREGQSRTVEVELDLGSVIGTVRNQISANR